MRFLGPLFFITALFGTTFFLQGYDQKVGILIENNSMLASVFFTQSTTSPILRNTYNSVATSKKKLNVLIVPGHEPNYGGTEFRGIKERDLNAELGFDLAQYLVEDGHYNVTITRGIEGWNPIFEDYFNLHADEIKSFVWNQKKQMSELVQQGLITTRGDNVPHNDAPDAVAFRLYGINKWANDNKADIIIHIHFNDSAPRRTNTPGEYNGFTIYTPDHQYSNSQATGEIAKNIFKRLSRMFPVSSLPEENQGIVEDQDLIATGYSNTVDAASLLIEYGYIYQTELQDQKVKELVLKEFALQTYLGLADFFGGAPLIGGVYQSTLLPYDADMVVKETSKANPAVLVFQAALTDKGYYPPKDFTKNDCPLSGYFGACTKTALADFQRNYNILGENGFVGTETRKKLSELFIQNIVSMK